MIGSKSLANPICLEWYSLCFSNYSAVLADFWDLFGYFLSINSTTRFALPLQCRLHPFLKFPIVLSLFRFRSLLSVSGLRFRRFVDHHNMTLTAVLVSERKMKFGCWNCQVSEDEEQYGHEMIEGLLQVT